MPENTANVVTVIVWVDWHDRAPLRDGLPQTHYRFQIMRENRPLSTDARAGTPEEAEKVIWEAFGWG